MTKEQLKALLDRVLTSPESRQQDAAEILLLIEQQDHSELRLTEEQAAEVRRRLAEPNPEYLTLEEFRERIARRYQT